MFPPAMKMDMPSPFWLPLTFETMAEACGWYMDEPMPARPTMTTIDPYPGATPRTHMPTATQATPSAAIHFLPYLSAM